MIADHDAAVEAVAKREPLINKPVEKERLIATLKDEMSHPEGKRIGLGDVDDARFASRSTSSQRPRACPENRRSMKSSAAPSCRRWRTA